MAKVQFPHKCKIFYIIFLYDGTMSPTHVRYLWVAIELLFHFIYGVDQYDHSPIFIKGIDNFSFGRKLDFSDLSCYRTAHIAINKDLQMLVYSLGIGVLLNIKIIFRCYLVLSEYEFLSLYHWYPFWPLWAPERPTSTHRID